MVALSRRSYPYRSFASLLFLSATFLLGSAASAKPTSAEESNAKSLVSDGNRLLKGGDANGALAKFQEAYAITHSPLTGLDIATAFDALGKIVEARAMVYEVSQQAGEPSDSYAFKQARTSAAGALAALDSRIPTLILHIEGPTVDIVTVTLDGSQVKAESLVAPIPLNPGRHEVVVAAPGYQMARASAQLVEGAKEPVSVPMLLEREVVVPKPIPLPPPAPKPPPPPPPAESDGILYAGIATSGALAALAVGTGIGAIVESRKNHEENRVLLGNTAVWTAIGATALGGATLTYWLVKPSPGDKATKGAAWVGLAPTVSGVVVAGTF